ncbi:3-dehydroquinate dehydratase [Sulfurimonas sp.]|nr:3-dehydroquinate dehydratase [Sulfurimonas sp.]
MKFSKGLLALTLTLFFQTSLLAEYLYKDEVVNNAKFTQEVQSLGEELFATTGVSLKLVMIRDLPNGVSIVEYEKEILKEFKEPTVLLTFAELNSKVDIMANDQSLYKYFNRKQVLSPVASSVQAFVMAVIYAKSFEDFKAMSGESGGTILPVLADKVKKGQITDQYAAAMFNGYFDIAEQIAVSQGVELSNATGESSKNLILGIKIVFYSVVVMGIIMYIRRKLYLRKQRLENE